MIHLLDRQRETIKTIESVNRSPEAIGWFGTEEGLRLVFSMNPLWDKHVRPEWNLAAPTTGKYVAVEKSPLPGDGKTEALSPDGKFLAEIEKQDRLWIVDVKSGSKRGLTFHEDDRRFVSDWTCQWVSPRYLRLYLNGLVFLDTQTLKMSYPLPNDDKSSGHTFSDDFQWMIWHKADDGLWLSPVVLPPSPP